MTPPVDGCLHLVVLGKEINMPSKDLIAKKAKACDSTKSPLILYFSIVSKYNLSKFIFKRLIFI